MKSVSDALLYGILDLGYVAPADIERVTAELCQGGVDVLQLRAKNHDELEIESFAQRIEPITQAAGVPLVINDYPELVPSVGAQGAHVGQDAGPLAEVRWRAGRALADEVTLPIIGRSTHSVEQAVAAQEEGADYIGFGPLFSTPTKPGRPAIGLDDIRRVHELVKIPIFCIGGINPSNLASVLEAGARRVVMVSALLCADDIVATTRDVRRAIADCEMRLLDR